MHERHTNKSQYFEEQIYTTKKHVIPFIRKYKQIDKHTSVLEIGCGEGGNLKSFMDTPHSIMLKAEGHILQRSLPLLIMMIGWFQDTHLNSLLLCKLPRMGIILY